MRRPANGPDAEETGDTEEKEKLLRTLTVQELHSLSTVCLPDARYCGRLVQVAGRFISTFSKRLVVHICPEDCAWALTDSQILISSMGRWWKRPT